MKLQDLTIPGLLLLVHQAASAETSFYLLAERGANPVLATFDILNLCMLATPTETHGIKITRYRARPQRSECRKRPPTS